jgi:hypothetical protein
MAGVSQPHYVVAVPGRQPRVLAYGTHVDAGYFAVLHPGLLAGRVFDGFDRPDGPSVAVVSSSLAQRAFGRTDVVGQRIVWHGTKEIIGVVSDQGFGETIEGPRPTIYLSRHQEPMMRVCLFIDVGDPRQVPSVVERLTHLDSEQPIDTVMSLPATIERAFHRHRDYSRAAALLAAVGLVLGLIGVVAAATCSMATRVPELALRLALGASPGVLAYYFVRRHINSLWWPGAVVIPLTLWVCWVVERAVWPLRLPIARALTGTVAILVLMTSAAVAFTTWRRGRMGPTHLRAALE